MSQRSLTSVDRMIGEIDKAIKVLAAPARATRPLPPSPGGELVLNETERRESCRLMRVNHAGEVAAQALYQGQACSARNAALAAALRGAGAEEMDHLAWCERRLEELDGPTSRLNPLWYAGSFALGLTAGMLGEGASLGFVTETESQVEAHLRSHLARLPAADARSRAILEQMTHDEMRHGADAAALGATRLGRPMRTLMHLFGRLMTHSSYWV